MQQTHRNRTVWAGLIAVVIVFGLGTRSPAFPFSRGITSYIGDAAWALAVFFGYGLLLPGLSTVRIVVLAAATSLLVELSQLYHDAWIDAIRGSTLGHLIRAPASIHLTWSITASGSAWRLDRSGAFPNGAETLLRLISVSISRTTATGITSSGRAAATC